MMRLSCVVGKIALVMNCESNGQSTLIISQMPSATSAEVAAARKITEHSIATASQRPP